ncbi:signal recognition particle receptor beta subunit [Gregarina niphandrodes]|uniref:Signal recognition particle receptor subunit beta n=1 Tax=Gregarina niphandrodes TaxID=110365 RepID=A0A023BBE5_GRENI|nr:signal recognition particle receptor beta subunit [Gregarina niphandrodes]EZG79576.1 signal recognition particle receptor beta subunit [Gregarina niphandrodes]|eukprot:XP_011134415.1 signal recognition particle receptor beta subunit [Gregarina niphandrodes]
MTQEQCRESLQKSLQVYGMTSIGKGNLDGFATYTTKQSTAHDAEWGGSAALNGVLGISHYVSNLLSSVFTHTLEKIAGPSVSAFVFCLDSTDVGKMKEAASYLFELMCLPQWQRTPPALCVLITKRDLSGARHKNLIRDDLEREIERLIRASRGAVLAADIPHSSNAVSRFLRRIQQKYHLPEFVARVVSFQAKSKSKNEFKFSKTPNTFFRFNNINSPFFQFLSGDNLDENVQLTKAFIQRATILQR